MLAEVLGFQVLAIHRIMEGATRKDAVQIRSALAAKSLLRPALGDDEERRSSVPPSEPGWSRGPMPAEVRRADDLLRRWDGVRGAEKMLRWHDCARVPTAPTVEKLTEHRDHPGVGVCPLQSDERTQVFTQTADANSDSDSLPGVMLRWSDAHEPNHGARASSGAGVVAPDGLCKALRRACKTPTAVQEMVRQAFAPRTASGAPMIMRGPARTMPIAPQLLADVALQAVQSTGGNRSVDSDVVKAIQDALPPPKVSQLIPERDRGSGGDCGGSPGLPDVHFHLLLGEERGRSAAGPSLMSPDAAGVCRPEKHLLHAEALGEAQARGERVWNALCTDDSDEDGGTDDSDEDGGTDDSDEDGGSENGAKALADPVTPSDTADQAVPGSRPGDAFRSSQTLGLISGSCVNGTRAAVVRSQVLQMLTLVVGSFYPYLQAARHELQEAMAMDLDDESTE